METPKTSENALQTPSSSREKAKKLWAWTLAGLLMTLNSTPEILASENPEKVIFTPSSKLLSADERAFIDKINSKLSNNKLSDLELLRVPVGENPYGNTFANEMKQSTAQLANAPLRKQKIKADMLAKSKGTFINIIDEPDVSILTMGTGILNTSKVQQILNSWAEKDLAILFSSLQSITDGEMTINNTPAEIKDLLSLSFDKIKAGNLPESLNKSSYNFVSNLLSILITQKVPMDIDMTTKYLQVLDKALDDDLSSGELERLSYYITNNRYTSNKQINKAEFQKLENKILSMCNQNPNLYNIASRLLSSSSLLVFTSAATASNSPFPLIESADKHFNLHNKASIWKNSFSQFFSGLRSNVVYAAGESETTTFPLNEIKNISSPSKKAMILTTYLSYCNETKTTTKACFTEIKKLIQENSNLKPLIKAFAREIYSLGNSTYSQLINTGYQQALWTALSAPSASEYQSVNDFLTNQNDIWATIFASILAKNNNSQLQAKLLKSTSDPQFALNILKAENDNKNKNPWFNITDINSLLTRISDPIQRSLALLYSLGIFGKDSVASFDGNQIKNLTGLSLSQFQELSQVSTQRNTSEPQTFFKDMTTLRETNIKYPDKDIAWKAFQNNNITRFSRYTPESLAQMSKDIDIPRDINKPLHLVLSAHSDHNGAIDAAVPYLLWGEDGAFATRGLELWNDANMFFSKLKAIKDKRIEHWWKRENVTIFMAGHWSKTAMQMNKTAQEEAKDGLLNSADKNWMKQLSDIIPNATVVFWSCDIAGETSSNFDNVARSMAEAGFNVRWANQTMYGWVPEYNTKGELIYFGCNQYESTPISSANLDGRTDMKTQLDTIQIDSNQTFQIDILAEAWKDAVDWNIVGDNYDRWSLGQIGNDEWLMWLFTGEKITLKKKTVGWKSKLEVTTTDLNGSLNIDIPYTLYSSDRNRTLVAPDRTVTTQTKRFKVEKNGKLTLNYEKPDEIIEVSDISLDAHELTLWTTQTHQLNVNISPANATNQEIIRESSNPSVVTVSQTGLVEAISLWAAEIYVKTPDGKLADTCKISVPTSIRELPQAKTNVYPNPASNALSISFLEDLGDYTGKVEIFDEAGNVLHSAEITWPTAGFDVSNLPVWTYFIVGEIWGKQIKERFVKR